MSQIETGGTSSGSVSVPLKEVAEPTRFAMQQRTESLRFLDENTSLGAPRLQCVPKSAGYEICKRALDIFLSSLVILIAFPLFLALAILIKLTSPGPVLFKQKRPGLNGKPFFCYKFRTMRVDAEKVLEKHPDLLQEFLAFGKIKNDPRITPIGAFLRKSSLDEFPQFFNVLLGDMSIIGPRPIVYSQTEQYGIYIDKLHSVKPGLGGLWQVAGRSSLSFEERVLLDMHYIDTRSLRLDLALLVKTAASVLFQRGAY